MSITLEHIRVEGFSAVVLANDALRVAVIPELGGKIVSLRSQRTGREWLWRNPYLPLAKPPLGATNFGLYDSGGWDEIFPTVNPCIVPPSAWGNRELTDHGELWYRPWETPSVELVEKESVSLTLMIADADLPFCFKRKLKLFAGFGPLEISYELTNLSDLPLPYLWAVHPLLAIEPGNEIRLPANTHLSSTGNVGLDLTDESFPCIWPTLRLASGKFIDLRHVPQRDAGFAIKLFAENVKPARIEIVDKDRDELLTISFDSERTLHCGLWLNYGAWSGANAPPYFNLGVEPTTSPHDDLSVAMKYHHAPSVPPSEIHQWMMTITAGP